MPRGVPNKKKSAAKKKTTRRRARSPVEAIPTIAASTIRSSISEVRQPATSTVVAPQDQVDVQYCVFGSEEDHVDAVIDWSAYGDSFDSFEQAEARARNDLDDGGGRPLFIVQIVGVVEHTGVTVRRAGPRL